MNLLVRLKSWGIIEIFLILSIVFLVRIFVYGFYRVPSVSMEGTMLRGEFFLSNKAGLFFLPPQQGDIVVFNDPLYLYSDTLFIRIFQQYVWGPESWSKRVIGIPGDTIQGTIEWGKPVIYRNGKKMHEQYIKQYPYLYDALDVFNVTLKDDQYWVMGDNRCNSYDSRSFGPLDGSMIHGKIVYRLFSFEQAGAWILWDLIMHPISWWRSVRWQRCMEQIV